MTDNSIIPCQNRRTYMQALSQSTKIYILAILDVTSKIASYRVQLCTCTSAKLHGVTGWYCIYVRIVMLQAYIVILHHSNQYYTVTQLSTLIYYSVDTYSYIFHSLNFMTNSQVWHIIIEKSQLSWVFHYHRLTHFMANSEVPDQPSNTMI